MQVSIPKVLPARYVPEFRYTFPQLVLNVLMRFPMQKWNTKYRRARQSGSARLFIFGLAIIGGMLWAGVQKLHTALTNRKPAVMSYEKFVQDKPDTKWLVITNCQLNLLRTCYLSYGGSQNASAYYIPVHDLNSRTGQVSILLKTVDPELLATINEIKGLDSESALKAWVIKNPTRVFPRRNVQGLVCFGVDLHSHDREELARVGRHLAKDFVILDANAQPNLSAGLSLSGAGLLCLLALIAYARKSYSESTSERMDI